MNPLHIKPGTKRRIPFLVLGLGSLLSSCSANTPMGGQTGGEVPDPLCDEQADVTGWDSSTQLGFTAAEAAVALTLSDPVTVLPTWLPPVDPERIDYITPAANTTLSFSIEVVTTHVRFVHSQARASGSGPQTTVGMLDDPCRSRLQTSAQVTLITPTGELNETFDATLNVFALDEALLEASLDATTLSGGLKARTPDTTVDELDLRLKLSLKAAAAPPQGSLELAASRTQGDHASYKSDLLATW